MNQGEQKADISDIQDTVKSSVDTNINYCYILYNDQNMSSYNGFTVNLSRRLRQHNCIIKGGAKYTTNMCKKYGIIWKFLAIVTSNDPIFTKKKALSLEWHIKYPDNKRPRTNKFNSPQGRLIGLDLALANPKFADILFIKEDFLNNNKIDVITNSNIK